MKKSSGIQLQSTLLLIVKRSYRFWSHEMIRNPVDRNEDRVKGEEKETPIVWKVQVWVSEFHGGSMEIFFLSNFVVFVSTCKNTHQLQCWVANEENMRIVEYVPCIQNLSAYEWKPLWTFFCTPYLAPMVMDPQQSSLKVCIWQVFNYVQTIKESTLWL